MRWETNAVPDAGKPPQEIINTQFADECDAVIAIFKTRLGSGTVEEINRAVAANKPVAAYFWAGPIDQNVNLDDLNALREFKQKISNSLFYAEFRSGTELRTALDRHITGIVAGLSANPGGSRLSLTLTNERIRVVRELYRLGTKGSRMLRALVSPLQMSMGDPKRDAERFAKESDTIATHLNSYHDLLYSEQPMLDQDLWSTLRSLDDLNRKIWHLGIRRRAREGWNPSQVQADELANEQLETQLATLEDHVRSWLLEGNTGR